jgi:hypothetical protein
MIIIPANLETIKTLKDGTLQLGFETNEINPSDVGILFSYRNNLGYLAFKPEFFNADQMDIIQNLKADNLENEKSMAKRMRNVLFRLWE